MNRNERRLVVNPEPLRLVKAPPEEKLLVCRLIRHDKTIKMSVHKDGCQRAPEDGKSRADGARWSVTAGTRGEMDKAVAEAEVEPAVWCPTCRGWGTT